MQLGFQHLLISGCLLRAGFFLFGIYQDNNLPVKYTDIDYLVFSDSADLVYNGLSPYRRETYRYTPLLAWVLVPNSWNGIFVHFGKFVFILCDILTGVLISSSLKKYKSGKSQKLNLILSSLWLLNPMVITISTRGSSESVLTLFLMLCVTRFLHGNISEAAFWLGLSIHFKIYPIIYLPAFMYSMSTETPLIKRFRNIPILGWVNKTNMKFLFVTIVSFSGWTFLMYYIYGHEFLYESYLYHLERLDHRHNFSLYNISLYYRSATSGTFVPNGSALIDYLGSICASMEKFAFVPQLALSAVIIPLLLAKEDLFACLFVQTFAFVAFNKVMTSQYFVWFLIFVPHFLAKSQLMTRKRMTRGLIMLALWIISQACWLFNAYNLEFQGESTFNKGLVLSSAFFFLSNCWMLSQFIEFY